MATSRKDYEAVARAIAKTLAAAAPAGSDPELPFNVGVRVALGATARDIASHFAASNPRFDRERFLKACGVKS